jgi:hypothetical protein
MSILDKIIGKVAPHDCLACGAEGYLLCAACMDRLAAMSGCCYRCPEGFAGRSDMCSLPPNQLIE